MRLPGIEGVTMKLKVLGNFADELACPTVGDIIERDNDRGVQLIAAGLCEAVDEPEQKPAPSPTKRKGKAS